MAAEYRRVLEEEAEVVVHAVDRLCREGTLAMEAKVLENAAWLLYVERKLRLRISTSKDTLRIHATKSIQGFPRIIRRFLRQDVIVDAQVCQEILKVEAERASVPEGHLVAPYVDAKMVTGSISRGILKVDLSIESRRHFRIRTLDINGSILSVPEQEGGRHHSMELKVPMSTLRNHIVVELVSVPTQKSRASPW